jgi:hypothetical protein
MPHVTKRRRHGQSLYARHRYEVKSLNIWKTRSKEFYTIDLGNRKEGTRTVEEKKNVLLSLKMSINIHIKLAQDRLISVHEIS